MYPLMYPCLSEAVKKTSIQQEEHKEDYPYVVGRGTRKVTEQRSSKCGREGTRQRF